MRIGEYLREKDKDTYIKLMRIDRKNKDIKLGDRVGNLMRHDSYKRVRGALKQIRWG